jgi:hypothetical protein
MKRTIIAAAAAGLLGLGLMFPAVAMPVAPGAPASTIERDLIQVRGGHGHGGGHHGMRRGGRGHHYGWSRGRHRGWR